MRHLLQRLPATGVVVTDAGYDVIAWNPLADALLGGLAQTPNLARRRFMEPEQGWEISSSEDFAPIAVSRLRTAARRYPEMNGYSASWTSSTPTAASSGGSGPPIRFTPLVTG